MVQASPGGENPGFLDSEHFFAEQPLKVPDPPTEQTGHVLELDAAYVRAIPERCGGRSSFGIVTGRLIKPDGAGGWHAYVIDETMNSLTQLHGFLDRQGVAVGLVVQTSTSERPAIPS
jgi:hypothetical protein